jgi:rfaE bifunctional protein nucleotidyltransferase chain/domain
MGRVLAFDEIAAHAADLRAAGRTIVLTNGHFDLLHIGHLDYLERARALGDALIVGVNGDASAARLKGPGARSAERARLLAALACVDTVIFDEDTAVRLVSRAPGHVRAATTPSAARAGRRRAGGRVEIVPFLPEHSTSALIERMRTHPTNPLPPLPARARRALGEGGGGQGERGEVARAAAVISLGSVTSRVAGLLRETVKSHLFGAQGHVSAFRVASLVPTQLNDLLVGGMVSSALVPVFGEYLARDAHEDSSACSTRC